MNLYKKENIAILKDVPVLTDGQIYLYAIQNAPQNNIKIGKTTNIAQRIFSLSGSNGGGSKIEMVYLSPTSTWIQSLEGTCHSHFNFCRIPGTEWFDGKKITFQEVITYIEDLFLSTSFQRCNELRKEFTLYHKPIEMESYPFKKISREIEEEPSY